MKSQFSKFISPLWTRRLAVLLGASLLGLLIAACGGGGSSPTPLPTTASTAVQVNMGDAPAEWMLSFSMNVSSMNLTHSSGKIAVSNSATPVEMIHRLGTMEPVALVNAPRGSYTGASLTIASCNFTYYDPATRKVMQKTINGPFNATVPFGSNVNVGASPLALNFDLDLEHSLTSDGSGAFQFSPQFHFAVGQLGGGNGSDNGNNPRYGGMHQMMGVISGVSSNSFSLVPLQAANSFTFQVNTATRFEGKVSSMEMLRTGMGVLVTASLQSDGSMLAQRVRGRMNSGGTISSGVIIDIQGEAPTQVLSLVMHEGAGTSMKSSYLSEPITVALTASTTYEIDSDRITLTGLPFTPIFDASNIYVGQSVQPTSDSGIAISETTGTITAANVRLHEQGFRGTADVAISPGASGSFILTLMPDCAFTALTGAKTIRVYQQTGTNVVDMTTIPIGTTLRVHGLLFNNGGEWSLIASTISSS